MAKLEKSSRKTVILDELDQNRSIDQEEYKERVKEYQLELLTLQRALMETKHSVVIVVEGPDAAGKGGAIKRLVEKLDPRTYRVYSVVKPTQEEYRYHYLWRFWNKLPPYGQMAIFDRSWYGRVLIERVEGFCFSDRVETRFSRNQRIRKTPGRRRYFNRQSLFPYHQRGAIGSVQTSGSGSTQALEDHGGRLA